MTHITQVRPSVFTSHPRETLRAALPVHVHKICVLTVYCTRFLYHPRISTYVRLYHLFFLRNCLASLLIYSFLCSVQTFLILFSCFLYIFSQCFSIVVLASSCDNFCPSSLYKICSSVSLCLFPFNLFISFQIFFEPLFCFI